MVNDRFPDAPNPLRYAQSNNGATSSPMTRGPVLVGVEREGIPMVAIAEYALTGTVFSPVDVAVPAADATDQQLMLRLRQQDVAALEALYDRHHQVALGLACKLLHDRSSAEDVVQDAFLTLWRQPERFDPGKGTPRGWLLAIVHHRSIDKLRRGRYTNRSVELTPNLIDEHQADPCDVATERIDSQQLLSALKTLPAEQRDAIELAFIHGRTHVEIAELMGCPLGTVKGRIRIGLSKLRTSLAGARLAPV